MEPAVYDVFPCPQCGLDVQVLRSEIACGVFRHGAHRSDGSQMPPHLPQAQCEELVEGGLIYGCGKPFQWNGEVASVCGYI